MVTGPVRIEASVWWCGDNWCDCTQAQIVAVYPAPNSARISSEDRDLLWEGRFQSGGPWADDEPTSDVELENLRDQMRLWWPEAEAALTWPSGVPT